MARFNLQHQIIWKAGFFFRNYHSNSCTELKAGFTRNQSLFQIANLNPASVCVCSETTNLIFCEDYSNSIKRKALPSQPKN